MKEENISEVGKKSGKKRSVFSYFVEIIIYIVLVALCIFWVPEHVMQRTVVDGESMEDTLHTGESLLVEKVSYHFTGPSRYDIVIFYPEGPDVDEHYVKRIYGLPGETIQIKEDGIYINNEVIADEYAKDGITGDAGIAEVPVTLKDDEYFVLGDNRDGSTDSRDADVGKVQKENIEGRVILRIWPLSTFGIP